MTSFETGQDPAGNPLSELRPSGVTDTQYLYAYREIGTYPAATPRRGKWLIFADLNQVDAMWSLIKLATEAGWLGDTARVSTALLNPKADDPNQRVIAVYTYDSEDRQDVLRIRAALRKLGITQRIPYKTDEATRNGRYYVKGDRQISMYYE